MGLSNKEQNIGRRAVFSYRVQYDVIEISNCEKRSFFLEINHAASDSITVTLPEQKS